MGAVVMAGYYNLLFYRFRRLDFPDDITARFLSEEHVEQLSVEKEMNISIREGNGA